uniref:Pkinase_Tyr domain-containing protein n=1 Tax=Heterorhabditis bacteriophora TaxID=37862 RepID=A0A1I7XBX0_HETBA
MAIIYGVGSNILTLPIPDNAPDGMKILMKQCWSTTPRNRPSFVQCLRHLIILRDELREMGEEEWFRRSEQWRRNAQNIRYPDTLTNTKAHIYGNILDEKELIRKRHDELKHAQDIREMYENKLRRTNRMYSKLTDCMNELHLREQVHVLYIQRDEHMETSIALQSVRIQITEWIHLDFPPLTRLPSLVNRLHGVQMVLSQNHDGMPNHTILTSHQLERTTVSTFQRDSPARIAQGKYKYQRASYPSRINVALDDCYRSSENFYEKQSKFLMTLLSTSLHALLMALWRSLTVSKARSMIQERAVHFPSSYDEPDELNVEKLPQSASYQETLKFADYRPQQSAEHLTEIQRVTSPTRILG